MNVLLIDPDRVRRTALAGDLAKAGLSVLEADDLGRALPALALGRADAVIADVNLPDTRGAALVQALHDKRPGLPVIIVTSHAYVDEVAELYKAGAIDVLVRPLDPRAVERLAEAMQGEDDRDSTVDDPARWDALMREATYAVKARRFGHARRLARMLVSQRPNDAAAFNLLGVVAEHTGDRYAGQPYFRAALAFDPTYGIAEENLSRSGEALHPEPLLDPEFDGAKT